MSVLTPLLIMFGLLILNGFFVAAEFAFTATRSHQMEARRGRSARLAVRAIDDLSYSLAGAQLGITIASLLLGYVAEPAIADLIDPWLSPLVDNADIRHTIAFIIALSIVVFLHMVIGEMAPKNIAIAAPEKSSLAMAIPFTIYLTLFRPIIWFLNGAANLLLRVFRIDPADVKESHSDDLASVIASGAREGIVEAVAHRLLTGAIVLGDLDAYDVMVPRPDMVALPLTASIRDVEQAVIEHGHSRIPIYDGTLDDVKGFVHVKDLLPLPSEAADQPIPASMIRDVLVVPESAAVDELLDDMRKQRSHLALVIDEHGGTAGIVTMEDIVEEVVGEIRDEHDRETEGVRRLSANRYVVDASLRPAEVRRTTGIDVPDGDYETVGGLVMDRAGRIPDVGDRVSGESWTMRVRTMDGRRVVEVDLISRG